MIAAMFCATGAAVRVVTSPRAIVGQAAGTSRCGQVWCCPRAASLSSILSPTAGAGRRSVSPASALLCGEDDGVSGK